MLRAYLHHPPRGRKSPRKAALAPAPTGFRTRQASPFATAGDTGRAMPQENVEIVRRIYEQVSVHHRLPKDLFEPACATDWTEVSPDFGVRYGARAADEALASYFETFENFHVEAEAVLHADAERVVTVVRDGGRMKAATRRCGTGSSTPGPCGMARLFGFRAT